MAMCKVSLLNSRGWISVFAKGVGHHKRSWGSLCSVPSYDGGKYLDDERVTLSVMRVKGLGVQ
jgi:hypothetical protein